MSLCLLGAQLVGEESPFEICSAGELRKARHLFQMQLEDSKEKEVTTISREQVLQELQTQVEALELVQKSLQKLSSVPQMLSE